MSQPQTKSLRSKRASTELDRILAGECLDDSTELARALEQAIPAAEEWLGSDIALELTGRGWVARYRCGSYRHTLTGPWRTPFSSAEDAIQALVDRANAARARAAAEELAL